MGSAANQSETFAASEFRFAIVAARYNDDIVEALLDAARAAWRKHGGSDAALQVEHVPGAFELPLAARALALQGTVDADMRRADGEYFQALIAAITRSHDELDAALAPLLDRSPAQLDPVEHALLLIGSYELQHRPEVPFRVVINEAVNLARRFGATDGHKFVNGVLDRAARLWRLEEH